MKNKPTEPELAAIAASATPVIGGPRPAGELLTARIGQVIVCHALTPFVEFGNWGGNDIDGEVGRDSFPGAYFTKEIWGGDGLPFVVRIIPTSPKLTAKAEAAMAVGATVI